VYCAVSNSIRGDGVMSCPRGVLLSEAVATEAVGLAWAEASKCSDRKAARAAGEPVVAQAAEDNEDSEEATEEASWEEDRLNSVTGITGEECRDGRKDAHGWCGPVLSRFPRCAGSILAGLGSRAMPAFCLAALPAVKALLSRPPTEEADECKAAALAAIGDALRFGGGSSLLAGALAELTPVLASATAQGLALAEAPTSQATARHRTAAASAAAAALGPPLGASIGAPQRTFSAALVAHLACALLAAVAQPPRLDGASRTYSDDNDDDDDGDDGDDDDDAGECENSARGAAVSSLFLLATGPHRDEVEAAAIACVGGDGPSLMAQLLSEMPVR